MSFRALVHEDDLGENLPPLRKFHLAGFDIDKEKFIKDVEETFADLPEDQYDKIRKQSEYIARIVRHRIKTIQEGLLSGGAAATEFMNVLSPAQREEYVAIRASRFRRIAKYEVDVSGRNRSIERVPTGAYTQYNLPEGDPRAVPRTFEEALPEIAEHPDLQRLLIALALEVKKVRKKTKMTMVLHQVRMDAPYTLPDRTHRDGCQFIVSAIPIIMEQAKGALSSVYDSQRKLLLRTQLQKGEGLFFDDEYYLHGISQLHTGKRGTIGIDINY